MAQWPPSWFLAGLDLIVLLFPVKNFCLKIDRDQTKAFGKPARRTPSCFTSSFSNGKHLCFSTIHYCGDSIQNLIGQGTHWIGRAFNVAARRGERLVPEKIADKKASGDRAVWQSCTVQPGGVTSPSRKAVHTNGVLPPHARPPKSAHRSCVARETMMPTTHAAPGLRSWTTLPI